MENQTMAASESIRKGLTVYQILAGIGGAAILLYGIVAMVLPVSSETLATMGTGGVSTFKLISILTGLVGAAVAVGFIFLVRGTGHWLEKVSMWTWGENVNTVELDDIHASMQRWFRAGQWVPVILSVIAFVGIAAAVVIPKILAARGTIEVLDASEPLGSNLLLSVIGNLLLFLVLPAVLNWIALHHVRLWFERVNRPLTRKPERRYAVSLTQLSSTVKLWFTAAQIWLALQVALLVIAWLLSGIVRFLILSLFINPLALVLVVLLGGVTLGFYLLPLLILEWSKVYMRGVTNALEPETRPARASV
jgi:hypothetical protein